MTTTTSSKKKNVVSIAPFQVGSPVIYAVHGLGEIKSVEERTIRDQTITFYEIFFANDKLTLYLPLSKIKEMGVRNICSKETAERVYKVITKPNRVTRGMWNKREQEYNMKMFSGSLLLTAEVVRDLFGGVGDPNRSYSERLIFEKAMYRIASELAVVLKSNEESIEAKIKEILTAAYSSHPKAKEEKIGHDFDDEDMPVYIPEEEEAEEKVA